MPIRQDQIYPVMDYSDPSPVHGYPANREQAVTCYLKQFDPRTCRRVAT